MTLRTAIASVVLSVVMPMVGGYVACAALSADLIGAASLAVASTLCFIAAGARSACHIEYVGDSDEEESHF